MNEKRFESAVDRNGLKSVFDNEKEESILFNCIGDVDKIVALLNSLSDENEQLKEDEKEYAKEILRLNELVKQYHNFRRLGGDY